MISILLSRIKLSSVLASGLIFVAFAARAIDTDRFDAAVSHSGRPEMDLKRDAVDRPADMLRLAGIKPGMQVADVLAGSGYNSELLSYVVGPKGKVFLINNEAYDHWSAGLEKRLAGNRLANVEHDTVDLNHMNLRDESLDAVFLIKVYHDFYWTGEGWPKIDPGAVLEQLARALKPGGVLLLIDHSAKPGTGSEAAAANLHRIDENYAIRDFAAHGGLKVVARSNLLKRPEDSRDQSSLSEPMNGKTDRFVLLLRKEGRKSSQ